MDHGCMSKYNIKIDANSAILILQIKLIINILKKKWEGNESSVLLRNGLIEKHHFVT
jgi:hypothetical protein